MVMQINALERVQEYQRDLEKYQRDLQEYHHYLDIWRKRVKELYRANKLETFPELPRFPSFPRFGDSLESSLRGEFQSSLNKPLGKPLEHTVSESEVVYIVSSYDELREALMQGVLIYGEDNKKIIVKYKPSETKEGQMTITGFATMRSYTLPNSSRPKQHQ